MKTFPEPRVLWETLRHLRLRQIRYQALRRLAPRRIPRPLPMLWAALPELAPADWPERDPGSAARFDGVDRFTFTNETRCFTGDWNDSGARRLWRYHLHYMAWIFDLSAGREAWILRWIRENPPARGDGWDPYPVSLRLYYWCRHFALSGKPPDAEILRSLGLQSAWLLENLEFHIDGNHLLENLLALVMAGFHFDLADAGCAAGARRIGRLAVQALTEQFLPDGGHCELSPMYHAILLERILGVLQCWPLGPDPFPGLRSLLSAKALQALAWLDAMSVSGRFALFNDSAYGSSLPAASLLRIGAALVGYRPLSQARLRSLPDSGYFRAQAGAFTVIFDAGPLGPNHQLGHAQGDMLSFCLWADGEPLIVHPGNFEYVEGEMRDYCRSTRAHNTLVPAGAEQAQWWASHRVGRRGKPLGVSARAGEGDDPIILAASHDAYRHLPGGPVHTRIMELTPGRLSIHDTLSPASPAESRIYFHFHPDCALVEGADGVRVTLGPLRILLSSEAPLEIEDSWYCPEFGKRIRNRAVVAKTRSASCRSLIRMEA